MFNGFGNRAILYRTAKNMVQFLEENQGKEYEEIRETMEVLAHSLANAVSPYNSETNPPDFNPEEE